MSPATQDLEQIKNTLVVMVLVATCVVRISTGLECPGSTTKYVTQGQTGGLFLGPRLGRAQFCC